MTRRFAFATVITVLGVSSTTFAIGPSDSALAAWSRCVAAADGAASALTTQPGSDAASTGNIVIEPGNRRACRSEDSSYTIQQWCGRVFLRHTNLEALLDSLAHVLPRQEDVVASRFLVQEPDHVRVYLRVVQRALLTVTLDTEHDLVFTRLSSDVATGRSEMTRVNEVEHAGTAAERALPASDEKGYLWKLRAYFRYSELAGGVMVEMESLTLSRGIPHLLRPIARPIIDRLARGSVVRTLDGLRRRIE